MPTINVAKPFNLLLSTQTKPTRYEAGEQEVSDEVAEHWYTLEHLVPAAEAVAEAAPAAEPASPGGDAAVTYPDGAVGGATEQKAKKA